MVVSIVDSKDFSSREFCLTNIPMDFGLLLVVMSLIIHIHKASNSNIQDW